MDISEINLEGKHVIVKIKKALKLDIPDAVGKTGNHCKCAQAENESERRKDYRILAEEG